jgi:hypothetical protein
MPIYLRRLSQHVHADAPRRLQLHQGTPRQFTRGDIEGAVTREFCAECGTHLVTRRPGLRSVNLKVGTLDDPTLYGTPQMAIHTIDKQPFHMVPEGIPSFERLPKR